MKVWSLSEQPPAEAKAATCAAAGALSISMQKSSSPFLALAFAMVLVLVRGPGNAALRSRSTLTGTVPAEIGNFIPSKVREPLPNGREQVFDTDASPEQCNNCPIAPVIVRSKVAPSTASLRSPFPVTVVFCPRVTELGEKPVILAFVLGPPQSFQLNDRSLAATMVARSVESASTMVGLAHFSILRVPHGPALVSCSPLSSV